MITRRDSQIFHITGNRGHLTRHATAKRDSRHRSPRRTWDENRPIVYRRKPSYISRAETARAPLGWRDSHHYIEKIIVHHTSCVANDQPTTSLRVIARVPALSDLVCLYTHVSYPTAASTSADPSCSLSLMRLPASLRTHTQVSTSTSLDAIERIA